jgi:hypothetical protein
VKGGKEEGRKGGGAAAGYFGILKAELLILNKFYP